jgi:hypothetical protein
MSTESSIPQLFRQLIDRANISPAGDWMRLRRAMTMNGKRYIDFEEGFDFGDSGFYKIGHDIVRLDTAIIWTTWTSENQRMQKNSIFVFDRDTCHLKSTSVNCYAGGVRNGKDCDYVAEMLEEVLSDDGFKWDDVQYYARIATIPPGWKPGDGFPQAS